MKKKQLIFINNMKNGDIFFTSSSALISRLVRFFTGGKCSHVGLIIELEGFKFAVEMTQSGCKMTPTKIRFAKKIPLVLSPKQIPGDFKQKVLADVGKVKYDYLGLILAPFFRTRTSEKICSEWITYIYGFKFNFLDREVEPIDILNILEND